MSAAVISTLYTFDVENQLAIQIIRELKPKTRDDMGSMDWVKVTVRTCLNKSTQKLIVIVCKVYIFSQFQL